MKWLLWSHKWQLEFSCPLLQKARGTQVPHWSLVCATCLQQAAGRGIFHDFILAFPTQTWYKHDSFWVFAVYQNSCCYFSTKKKKKWKLPPTSITFALKKSYSFGSTPSNRNLRQQFFKQKSEDCAQPEVLISVFLIIISLITKLITTFFTFLAVRTVFRWIFFKQSIFIVYKTLCQTTGALGRVAVYFT